MLRARILTTALLTTALLASPAMARENYALLIGASTYPSLDQDYWLKGPANDVKLVQTYLTTAAPVPFAAENVTLLADGVQNAVAPTLAAIRGAFGDLTAKVEPGDFVYLHFSGHGSQAPAADPDSELDGLDELFLPVDIGPWEDGTAMVENALVDDEIGSLIDGLRAKGANVWAVFDSCHSGTVTRGAPDDDEELRTRHLPPEALGLTADMMEPVTRAIPDPRAAPEAPMDITDQPGSFVAFFAAQTNERTPEKNLPAGKPGRVPQGVFTYALFQVLAEYPGATYGQISQEVLRKYAVSALARTTPMFEGDLDQVAFGGTAGPRVAQWQTVVTDGNFAVPAGSLHGLAEGEILAVLAAAADETSAAIGYVQIAGIDTFTATATPIDHDGITLPAELPKRLTLRKIAAALDFTLTIALPDTGTIPAAALDAALTKLTDAAGPRMIFVASGAAADLRLAVLPDSPRPDAIWVLPSTGLGDADYATIPSVSTADKDAETLAVTLADTLGAMSKALNLLKLGAGVGAGDLDVTVEMQTRNKQDRTLRALPQTGVPRLIPQDEVHVLAQNNMDIPVDINVLYVAANFEISHWYSGRLQPGDTLKQGLFKIGDTVLGAERMIVVMTPAKPQSPVEDLSFLAQPELDMTRDIPTALGEALREAGFGETTRSAVALEDDSAGPQPGILQLELRTVAAN